MRLAKAWILLSAILGWALVIPLSWSEEGRAMPEKSEKVVRDAHGAGRWFPGRHNELKAMVQGYI